MEGSACVRADTLQILDLWVKRKIYPEATLAQMRSQLEGVVRGIGKGGREGLWWEVRGESVRVGVLLQFAHFFVFSSEALSG